jgi:anti-anti-sigma factor
MFQYEIRHEEFLTLLSLQGDMDIEATEVVQDEITPQLADCKAVEIDFSQIRFVDSSGIGLLISLIASLREADIRATVVNLSNDVRMIFELLQLHDILGPGVIL